MLALKSVRKSYGTIVAVDDLTLEVRRGEVFGLLGPNGAGKSTTVALAVGILRPDGGSVAIDGGDPGDPAVRARIGIAPQALAVYEDLSAEQNLRFFGRIQGLRGAALAARVSESLAFVGLDQRRRDLVRNYSGGMKRRLNLAAAILHDPLLLLLDEPTVGVDPQSRNAIFENILALKRRGRTIIYTTHYMEEAERLCDRVGIIDRGRLLALDTVPRLVASVGDGATVVFQDGGAETRVATRDPFATLRERHAAGTLGGFRVEHADLESVFLHLTGRHLRD
jgi:ABC-2 type transport system ATP-binding protein